MTQSEAKAKWMADRAILKGAAPAPQFASPILIAKLGRRTMTPHDYYNHRMHRGRMINGETAWSRKLERAGWCDMERADGGFHRFARI